MSSVQQEQMAKSLVAIVDENDNTVGTCDKYTAHRTELGPKRHRAFSLFLFDASGRLLLQQRSEHKLTFPLIWANTCCSHPEPDEPVIAAACRRVKFELNIDVDPVACELCECGVFEYSAESGDWTEHEIDHVVFGFFGQESIPFNTEEVAAVRWVTEDELKDWIARNPEQLSPWLRKIHEQWLVEHWKTFTTTHKMPKCQGGIVRL